MKRKSFEKLLSVLKLDKNIYQNGLIKEVIVNNQNNSWNIYFEFLDVVEINSLDVFQNAVIEYFISEGVSQVNVFFDFKNKHLRRELVEQYFKYFLAKCQEEKPRFACLNTFVFDYEDNLFKIYVASKNEEVMVSSLLEEILEYFKRYGLTNVSIEIAHSAFQTPIEKEIEERLKKSTYDTLREQELYDQAINKNEPETQKEKIFRKKTRLTKEINGPITRLKDVPSSEVEMIKHQQLHGNLNFVVEGDVVSAKINEPKGYKIYEGVIYDGEDSIIIKSFLNERNGDEAFYLSHCMEGKRVRVFGNITNDAFSRDIVLSIREIFGVEKTTVKGREDKAFKKRVELHAHTKMSTQDGVVDVDEYIGLMSQLGHSALAITDHHNVQALPDFDKAARKANIKPIFGVEGSFVDEDSFKIALTDHDIKLDEATFVVYDLETTGLSSIFNEIIEIGAVKVQNGMVVDEYQTFVKPSRKITEKITEITSITNDDVRNSPTIDQVIHEFHKFIEGSVLVAHNATFDNSHLYRNLRDYNLFKDDYPTIDTMQLARAHYSDRLKTFRLDSLAKLFDVELAQHHRAVYDARATANIFIKMLSDLKKINITNYNQINNLIDNEVVYKLIFPSHFNILAKNKAGLKNLYNIISDSHTKHYHREPRILKRVLMQYRDNLLIGSGCGRGEVFDTASRDSYENLLKVVEMYDYLEVQPVSYYKHLLDSGDKEYDEQCIKESIKRIIKAGKEKNKLVVATGDVHILNKEDLKFREIFINALQVGGGIHPLKDVEEIPTQHYLTTEEMLSEFSFLGNEVAEEIVVTNTNIIADMIESFPLLPNQLFAPSDDFMKDLGVPSFKDGVMELTYTRAKKLYGAKLPEYIEKRIKKELDSIIGNNYASIYYISHLLVKHSKDAGYVVGSRGSVGSSLVAFLMGITEVNSLAPHYFCPSCNYSVFKFSEEEKKLYKQEPSKFDSLLADAGTGFDLPEANCPHCNTLMKKDGIDIPFETFLGFKGDKVPDIDLNFSGEYQSRAHEFCRELFGEDRAFRAGTISTIAEKTAYGFVRDYLRKKGIEARNCEVTRIANKITGVKRSTGQHPGGIVVIPKEIDYTDITPVQYPADDITSSWRTTHFDYHKFEENLLKLDILGHDDPTMIRHLMNFVEAEPDKFPFSKVEDIPLADQTVLSVFSGVSSLGVDASQVHEVVGTTGLPEFGTPLTKEMLREIRPKTVSDLIRISGLSHGTDVWTGNARDYMLGLKKGVGPVPFQELICCRDDIMVYLMGKGMPAFDAFEIMERVRKGRGVTKEQEKLMLQYNVPNWYIDSCKSIKYMFPKAHAAAYVIMALRIAWFKVHRPLYYYAAYFSRRANAFDPAVMAGGYERIKIKLKELEEKIANKSISAKENDLYTCLLIALEMTARGYTFNQIDIFKSDWRDFQIEGNALRIPFKAMESLGEATAKSITDARSEQQFTSIKDVLRRTKINTTLYERLVQIGSFGNLPEDDQLGLF